MIKKLLEQIKEGIRLRKYNELRQKINRKIEAEIGEEARKQLEEEARKNLDSGIGKGEILRQNVKKGGKYIVFIPVTDQGEIEDEDGKRIGTKTGEDKILEYQEYLKKVFEGTEIVPQSHSLLGSYSKAKNKEELARRVILARERESKIKAELSVIDNKRSENLGKLTVDYQNKKMDLKINLISIAIYLIIMQVVIMGIVALVLMGVFKLLNIDIDNVSDGFLLSLSIIITACFYFWYVNFEMKGINDEHTKKISAVNKYYDDLITETITRINRETK